MFYKGATAVQSFKEEGFAVAVKDEGIFHYLPDGNWKRLLHTKEKIRTLAVFNGTIYGGGDQGLLVRSIDSGKTWTSAQLPTKASVWSIAVGEEGTIAAHGKHSVYLSYDSGASWVARPVFAHLEEKPVIRSLCFYHGLLLIGTQIHKENGGIWITDPCSGETMLLKEEKEAMIASMLLTDGRTLLAAKGSSKSGQGTIERFTLEGGPRHLLFQSREAEEASFLNLSMDDEVIYATSSQDQYGYSRIYQIDLLKEELILSDTIRGHGLGIANRKEEFFVSALYESKYVKPYSASGIFH